MRFPPACRLRKPAEFAAVQRRGQRLREGAVWVRWLPNGDDQARLGMAIARRTAGNAVKRNRVKRLIRESFRQHRDRLPPVDLTVGLTPGHSKDFDVAEFNRALENVWSRLIARCDSSPSG